MQAVSTYDKIKAALAPMFKLHLDAIFVFSQAVDLISENDFSLVLDFVKKQKRQSATCNCYITAAGQFQKSACPEASDTFAAFVDDSHLSDVIANAIDLIAEPHALGY